MTKANSLRAIMVCGLSLASYSAFAAPTAQEIVAKAKAVMKGAKTYQATLQMVTTGGPMTMNMNAQIKTTGAKTWAQVAMNMNGPQAQQNPMAAMLQNIQVVDDGVNTWTYLPSMKQYKKGPSGGAKRFNFGDQFLSKVDTDSTLKLAGVEKVSGKPAYAVEASPKNAKPGQGEKVTLYFDQATYHFVQMKANQGRPAGNGAPAMNQSVVMVIKDEKINQPIPESTFKFTPPAGAKEMQGNGGMMFGGGAPKRK